MTFATIDEQKKSQGTFKRIEYMDTSEGEHKLRIIEPSATKFYVHYVGFSYLRCLGDECPICENNKKLMFSNPEDFRKEKTWKPRTERFYFNVLDKTKAKVCSNCQEEVKNLNLPLCPECQTMLPTEAMPLNKVKVLAKGKTLLEDINLLSTTVRNDADEILPITSYDWVLVVKGTGKDTTTSPSPRYVPGKESFDLEGQELFDLSNATIALTREEMMDVLSGTSIKDIFAIRKAAKVGEGVSTGGDEVLMADIRNSVDEIFKK